MSTTTLAFLLGRVWRLERQPIQRQSQLSLGPGVRRAGNDNGGEFDKQPDQNELCNQAEQQRDKVWRPQVHLDASLGQDLEDAGNGGVGLNRCVQQIKVPSD